MSVTFTGSIAGVIVGLLGLVMLLTPVDWLLELDRMGHAGGYRIYRRAPSPERGRFRAMLYYRILGSFLLGVAALLLWPA